MMRWKRSFWVPQFGQFRQVSKVIFWICLCSCFDIEPKKIFRTSATWWRKLELIFYNLSNPNWSNLLIYSYYSTKFSSILKIMIKNLKRFKIKYQDIQSIFIHLSFWKVSNIRVGGNRRAGYFDLNISYCFCFFLVCFEKESLHLLDIFCWLFDDPTDRITRR